MTLTVNDHGSIFHYIDFDTSMLHVLDFLPDMYTKVSRRDS